MVSEQHVGSAHAALSGEHGPGSGQVLLLVLVAALEPVVADADTAAGLELA